MPSKLLSKSLLPSLLLSTFLTTAGTLASSRVEAADNSISYLPNAYGQTISNILGLSITGPGLDQLLSVSPTSVGPWTDNTTLNSYAELKIGSTHTPLQLFQTMYGTNNGGQNGFLSYMEVPAGSTVYAANNIASFTYVGTASPPNVVGLYSAGVTDADHSAFWGINTQTSDSLSGVHGTRTTTEQNEYDFNVTQSGTTIIGAAYNGIARVYPLASYGVIQFPWIGAPTVNITISGTPTTSDQIWVTLTDAAISGSPLTVQYTVAAGDTLATIAQGIAGALANTVNITTNHMTASATGAVVKIAYPGQDTLTVAAVVHAGAGTETFAVVAAISGGSLPWSIAFNTQDGGAVYGVLLGSLMPGAARSTGSQYIRADYWDSSAVYRAMTLQAVPSLVTAGGGAWNVAAGDITLASGNLVFNTNHSQIYTMGANGHFTQFLDVVNDTYIIGNGDSTDFITSFVFGQTASSNDFLTLSTPAAGAGYVAFTALGADTDVDLRFTPKGAGLAQVSNAASWSADSTGCGTLAGSTGCLKVKDNNGNTIQVPVFGTL